MEHIIPIEKERELLRVCRLLCRPPRVTTVNDKKKYDITYFYSNRHYLNYVQNSPHPQTPRLLSS